MGVSALGMDASYLISGIGFGFIFSFVTIALLPVSVSLGLSAFNGFYCAGRSRRGSRTLVAPLWVVIGLFWWFFYFLLIYSFFDSVGLQIPISGSADVTWNTFQLAEAHWGWELGLWIAVVGLIIQFIGGAVSMRGAKVLPVAGEVRKALGFHSAGLIVIGVFNIIGMLLLFFLTPLALLLIVPVALLFVMSVLARNPKTVRIRTPMPPPQQMTQPFQQFPQQPWPPQWPQAGGHPPAFPGMAVPPPPIPQEPPAAPRLFCPNCGTSLAAGATFCQNCGTRMG
jgi:hypothetical protein